MEQLKLEGIVSRNAKMIYPLCKTVWQNLIKLDIFYLMIQGFYSLYVLTLTLTSSCFKFTVIFATLQWKDAIFKWLGVN